MQTSLDDFKTGWYGITLGLKASEIDSLIENLLLLRENKSGHFHARSDFKGTGGIGDIELHLVPEESPDDMVFDYSSPIEPSKRK